MPAKSKYPLHQIVEMRQASVSALEAQLAQEAAATNRAAACVVAQQKLIATNEHKLSVEQQRQVARMTQRPVCAHELMQSAAHHTATREEAERLQKSLVMATAELEKLSDETKRTEKMLVVARQKLAVVERHQNRHARSIVKQQEARSEQDAAETWQALRSANNSGDAT